MSLSHFFFFSYRHNTVYRGNESGTGVGVEVLILRLSISFTDTFSSSLTHFTFFWINKRKKKKISNAVLNYSVCPNLSFRPGLIIRWPKSVRAAIDTTAVDASIWEILSGLCRPLNIAQPRKRLDQRKCACCRVLRQPLKGCTGCVATARILRPYHGWRQTTTGVSIPVATTSGSCEGEGKKKAEHPEMEGKPHFSSFWMQLLKLLRGKMIWVSES